MESVVRLYKYLILFLTGSLITACDLAGGPNAGPDEFAVVTRAPLSLPPDYDLRPPRPGAARPNENSPRDDARTELLKNLGNQGGRSSAKKASQGNFTSGEAALLKRAEALNVDPRIRELVARDSGLIIESDALVDTLVFWKNKKPAQTLVNPKLEAKRLRGNAALGKPATTGTTPIIKQ
tara:strand:+ start:746 stop:1285 length:540 start_codon:yes stop_codon:yes gene_type:complete